MAEFFEVELVERHLFSRQLYERQSNGTKTLLDLLQDPFSNSISQNSVWASLATSALFTFIIAVGFSLVRPYNSVVYAPKLKVADEKHAPPPMGRGMLAWIAPVMRTSEPDLLPLLGLDAIVFLRVLRMCRDMFIIISIVGCGILIPINLAKGGGQFAPKGFVARVTPVNTTGDSNWAITACAWLFDAVICAFLYYNYRIVLRLRRQYYNSPEYQASLHARTLMINDIPRSFRSDEGIGRLVDQVVPTSSFSRCAVARNVKELPELIEQHDQTVRELEKCLAIYLKDPKNLPSSRPLCKPSKEDPSYSTYPKGQKIDAIEYHTRRIKALEILIKEIRLSVDNRDPLSYGFTSFEEIPEAHSIAYAARNKHPQGTTIVLAPRPNDIIWKNMPLTKSQLKRRRFMNTFYFSLLTLIWIAPNAMISIFLVQLSNLGRVWPAFQRSLSAHTTWWAIVQGVASPAVTSLVYLILPIIFRRMLIQAGDRTKTARERHVTGKLYTFFVFNFLIVFSIFGSVWSFVTNVIGNTNNHQDAWHAIQNANIGLSLFISLCRISPFWITWLLQRNLGAAIDLAQLWTLFWGSCQRRFKSPTPREMIELTAPPPFDYASYYNYFLFYSTVALCYGAVQPLVIPAAAVYFTLDVWLKKYLLLYVFVTKVESGGMFWRMIFNRFLFAAGFANCVMFLAVWAKGDGTHYEAYAVAPLPILLVLFKWYCSRTFDEKIHYFTSREVLKDPETARSKFNPTARDKLSARFGHPALYKPLITPMVHAKAQNILASVYAGRLSDGKTTGSVDSESVSGYSDMFAMESMKTGQPGRTDKSAGKNVPGFEIVPENRLDFAYYKSRAEFGDDHGGGGGLYGRAEDIVRTDTPGSVSNYGGGDSSRPSTPVRGMGGMGGMGFGGSASPQLGNPLSPFDSKTELGGGMTPQRTGSPLYASRTNDSQTALVQSAADISLSPRPMPANSMAMGSNNQYRQGRDASVERLEPRLPPGFLGGGPQGYGGVPQNEEPDEHDPMSYNYFRGRRPNNQG